MDASLTSSSCAVSTTPYESIAYPTTDKFRSVLFLNTVQSLFSTLSSLLFLAITKRRPGVSWRAVVGLPTATKGTKGHNPLDLNRTADQSAASLLKSHAFISVVSSMASPFGFLALSHISFPTLLLGKSCKLVPVMLMNIVLYRRKFPLHKYALVAMVTAGIWAFMAFKEGVKKTGGRETSSALGLGLLTINLLLDGVVNSTQDQVFSLYKLDGPQMMFFMNVFSTLLTSIALILPTSLTPSFLVPTPDSSLLEPAYNALSSALEFIATHPTVTRDILLFSLTGAIGQLFIFLTLSTYGSLTLVTITVTRKMVTMLLSVFVFNHSLTLGQWGGVLVVFAAIAMEAEVKRRESAAKKRSKAG